MRPLSPAPSRSVRLAAALAAALALGLTACSGGEDSGGAGGSSAGDGLSSSEVAPGGDEAGTGATEDRAAVDGDAQVEPVAATVTDRRLTRRAEVSLRVDDVAAAAARLRAVATGAGGLVTSEEVTSDPGAPETDADGTDGRPVGWGVVTVSVPAEKLDSTLDAVAELGTVLDRRTSTEDVTGRYVDTASRVESMKASVERVRALMTEAEKLSDVVALEGELSRRQADLEALQQQLAALDDQVALAPVTVQLSTHGDVSVQDDPTGFLAGLADGWAAFTTSVRLVLTLVGALVPFLVAGALVLVPVGWWWRRRPRPASSGTAPAA